MTAAETQEFFLGPETTGHFVFGPEVSVEAKTTYGSSTDGVPVLQVKAGPVEAVICPARGMGLMDVQIQGTKFCWTSPVNGPVHPRDVNLFRPDGLGWLEGFSEAMVRCGLRNVGPPQFDSENRLTDPIHGTIAHLPANKIKAVFLPKEKTLTIKGTVQDTVFHFQNLELTVEIVFDLHDQSILVRDTITNQGNRHAEVCLMHHWNFGLPAFGEGSQIQSHPSSIEAREEFSAQFQEKWNQMDAPGSAKQESVFLMEPEAGKKIDSILLTDSAQEKAVLVSYPTESFSRWTLWRNPVHASDGFAIGIEPGTCYPSGKDEIRNAGHMQQLEAGDQFQTWSKVTYVKSDPTKVKSLLD